MRNKPEGELRAFFAAGLRLPCAKHTFTLTLTLFPAPTLALITPTPTLSPFLAPTLALALAQGEC
jgi:hypothetical protein